MSRAARVVIPTMELRDDDAPLRLGGRPLPGWLDRTLTVIRPGATLAYVAERWAGAVVVVEFGRIELESESGERVQLSEGALLALERVPVVAIRNVGPGAAVLAAISRRIGPDEMTYPAHR
jgi:hypothetical protein